MVFERLEKMQNFKYLIIAFKNTSCPAEGFSESNGTCPIALGAMVLKINTPEIWNLATSRERKHYSVQFTLCPSVSTIGSAQAGPAALPQTMVLRTVHYLDPGPASGRERHPENAPRMRPVLRVRGVIHGLNVRLLLQNQDLGIAGPQVCL